LGTPQDFEQVVCYHGAASSARSNTEIGSAAFYILRPQPTRC
jgi:hypothetical protein